MVLSLAVLATTLTLHLASTVSALPGAPPSLPRFTSIQYSGNGCPSGARLDSGNFDDPTFAFRSFAIQTSAGAANLTANCQIHVQADGASSGWQVALSEINVQARAVLDPSETVTYYAQVYFSEDAATTGTFRGNIVNPGSERIDSAITINQSTRDAVVWSPCIGGDGSPGLLNVNFRTVLNGEGYGYFEVFTEHWKFNWRRC
ncbi:hypothetical protein VTK73DRAFT_6659 [Phialemonium thermophilum]|uniref:Secreted protein n=1 Tax=Phialemonium thermophilum TaxID=223376 RepID=A0ABR3WIJ3_9PEZI